MSSIRVCQPSIRKARLIRTAVPFLLTCGLVLIPARMARAQEPPPPTSQMAAPGSPATQPARPSPLYGSLKNAQLIAADLKETFASGAVTKGDQADRPDSRMALLSLLFEKIEYTIKKRVADPQEREAALARLQVARDHLTNEILPAYEKAKASQSPEGAKAIVALMDGLDERLTKVQDALPRDAGPQSILQSPTAQPGPGPARAAAPLPLPIAPPDSWTLHVQQFIVAYKLDGSQQEQAGSILKNLQNRRQEYQAAHKLDYEAAAALPDKTRQSAELQSLEKPITGMFEELKTRLLAIATDTQRKAATSAPATRPR